MSCSSGNLLYRFALATAIIFLSIGLQAQTITQTLSGHLRPEIAQGKINAIEALPGNEHLHLAFQLPLHNEDEFHALLSRIYDPESPDYHHYLTVDQFKARFAPTEAEVQSVVDFAKKNGMTVLSTPTNRMLVEVDATAETANSALHLRMNRYQHPTEARSFYSADREPSLELATKIYHIAGLNDYSQPHARFQSELGKDPAKFAGAARSLATTAAYPPTPTGSGPYGSYIPSDFRGAYYGTGPLDGSGQVIGLLEFMGYDQVDLDNFYATTKEYGYNEPAAAANIKRIPLGGLTEPMSSNGNDAEAVLDIVYALSMTPNLKQLRFYECCSASYSGAESGAVVMLNAMAADNVAKQISISYGWGPEQDAEDPVLQELAAQGQSVFAATGDYGSPMNPGNNIIDDYYPSDNAWVTSVSMSLVTTKTPGGLWANEIYSAGAGGGVNAGPLPTPMPSYQSGIQTKANQASSVYRNVPDVVSDGYGSFLCGGGGSTHGCYPNKDCQSCTNGGSSMSAPIWASYMALVNEEATLLKKPAVGFLNPALYAIGKSTKAANDFHDITSGNNACCGQVYVPYQATKGYDLVSGWGAPIGKTLMMDLINQAKSFSVGFATSHLTLAASKGTVTDLVEVTGAGQFTGSATLSLAGLPTGVTAKFDATTVKSDGHTTLHLTSTGGTTAGHYPVTVTATSGTSKTSAVFDLEVEPKNGGFLFGSAVTAIGVPVGTKTTGTWYDGSTNQTWAINANSVGNYSGSVKLTTSKVPDGVTVSLNPSTLNVVPGTQATASITVSASDTAAVGQSSITIYGSDGASKETAPLLVNVTPMVPCAVALPSPYFAINVGQNGSLTMPFNVTTTLTKPVPVTMAITGLPSGWKATFSPAIVTPPASGKAVVSNLTVTADSSVALGKWSQATISCSYQKFSSSMSLYWDPSGSLTASKSAVTIGANITLNYATDPTMASTSNWIALVAHGANPQSAKQLLVTKATLAKGTVTLSTKTLAAGKYDAWLYYGGYSTNTTLAGPVVITVSK